MLCQRTRKSRWRLYGMTATIWSSVRKAVMRYAMLAQSLRCSVSARCAFVCGDGTHRSSSISSSSLRMRCGLLVT
jgi:hypothetical protein